MTGLEGQPALIHTGSAIPLPYSSATVTPFGATVQQSIEYRDVGSGFYVTPRITGDRVNLEISPYAERPSSFGGGAIDQRGLSTTVTGQLGEWIALGGAGGSAARQEGGLAYSTRQHDSETYDVWVKVEVVP